MRKITTLCLIKKDDKLLLGMKKRGFGVGRWNGFGGKVTEGETIMQAAKREMQEECGVLAQEIEQFGLLDFSWASKPEDVIEVNVFKINKWQGEPQESEEMKPGWFDLKEIPYEQMWDDDKHWLPLFLQGKKIKGKFIFDDNDKILEKQITEVFEI